MSRMRCYTFSMPENDGYNDGAKRLVKAWLPVELVRRMDSAILSSRGGFEDRTDFIAEGIQGLLDELRYETPDESAGRSVRLLPPSNMVGENQFGDWLDHPGPTLPPAPGPSTNFGLHNRDFPTIWALDWLGRLVSKDAAPISWEWLTTALVPLAWEEAERLRNRSVHRAAPLKAEAGFPTHVKKRENAEKRFLTHFAATSQGRGPWFVFRMVGTENGHLAPTPGAIALIESLKEIGVSDAPPFSPAAWRAFNDYLRAEAPEEIDTWLRVLGLVAEEPTRTELAARCSWWSGSQAETNANSYVARGREWGLVEPALIDGHYRLTALGQETLHETRTIREET
jgi:hypothetical protein